MGERRELTHLRSVAGAGELGTAPRWREDAELLPAKTFETVSMMPIDMTVEKLYK